MAPLFWKKSVFTFPVLFILVFLQSGCFRQWRATPGDVRRYLAASSLKPTFHTIERDSMKLFCLTTGSDTLPPLLLVHGAPGNWFDLRNMLDDTFLRKKFQVIVIDRPGYGNSRKKDGRKAHSITSIDRQAHQIALALTLNRSGEKAIVLGRSYGGPIAARIAMLNPDKVKHLIMVAPPVDPSLEKFYWFSSWGNRKYIRFFLPGEFNTATDEKFDHVAQLEKLSRHWTSLQMEMTVVQGGDDWVVDPANLDFSRRMLPPLLTKFVYLPKAGHAITETHPELIRELILRAAQPKELPATTVLSGVFHKNR